MALELNTDFSISRLFLTKKVRIFIEDLELKTSQILTFSAPTIADIYTDDKLSMVYKMLTSDFEDFSRKACIKIETSFDFLDLLLFKLIPFREFSNWNKDVKYFLSTIFKGLNITYDKNLLTIDGVIITKEIWEYFIYVLKLCYGEKARKPQAPISLEGMSEEARKFFLAQQELEAKLQKIRRTGIHYDSNGKAIQNTSDDAIAKIFLTIIYEFPSLTFDYLFQQTMAQILWLQRYAAGAMSYEVNAQAFAAGNFKKGKKLEPFIK